MISRPRTILVAIVLGLLVTTLLAFGHLNVGYVRDEGIYFEAGRRYANWMLNVVEDPRHMFDHVARDRVFQLNHEHPALMKLVAGLVARALVPLGIREGAAMRLPAQVLAGVGVSLLYIATVRRHQSWSAGILAAGMFISLPRVWFHAGLNAFDVPVAVMILVVVLVYQRALRNPWWGVVLGLTVGIAAAVKHNALVVMPVLVLHGWGVFMLHWWRGESISKGAWFPWPWVAMLIFAPMTYWLLWPWLWTHPIGRFEAYLAFHRFHHWYNMAYWGHNYNQPPMPWSYPWVMTWATVPTVLLVLAGLGGIVGARNVDLTPYRGTFWRPSIEGETGEAWLWLVLATIPLLLISSPQTPIFGGTKHWITAYPFMAMLAATGWCWAWSGVSVNWRRVGEPLLLLVVLAPSSYATWHAHPFSLSEYAPLFGGARGAANMGMNRGFWGHATIHVLDALKDPVQLHDTPPLVQHQLTREGRWPAEMSSSRLHAARSALVHHEMHTLAHEVRVWDHFQSFSPIEMVVLDDVPLLSVYAE